MDNNIKSWTEKYYPKKITDLIGNNKAINSIIQWLKSFNKNKKEILKKNKNNKIKSVKVDILKKVDNILNVENSDCYKELKVNKEGIFSCLLVTGNHGVGKTCLVNTILNNLNYEIKTISFSKIQKLDNIKDIINKITNNNDIISLIENKKNDKIVLLIDDLESLMSKIEISFIMSLIEKNDLKWIFPIIFISNNQHNKFINEIKKKSMEIKLWQPYNDTMMILLNRIKELENIQFENINIVNKVIEHSQKDFRKLIITLQDIKYLYENKIINKTIINEYINLSKCKDLEYDLFKVSNNIIHKYIGIDDILKYYEIDKVNLPLMIQENYIKKINNLNIDNLNNANLNNAKNIMLSLVKGDLIENYIYSNQNWNIHEVHGFYACVNPSYLLNNNNNLNEINKIKLDFPSDLNKTSIKKINKKNILKINELLQNMNIKDYVYINQLLKNLIENNKMSECIKLFKGYNFSLEYIDKLLKIDKIKSTKLILSSKQKKELLKELNK